MTGIRTLWLVLLALLAAPGASAAQGDLQVADLGRCELESGEAILDCRVAYRTAGELDAARSNAVLFTTWFGGNSANIMRLVGPGRLVDTSKWYVVVVDAFGDGDSSSPSNSPSQPGARFPTYTIRDMVRAQHRLLREVLGLDHLHAVTGISMGGMQTFEWMVTYPEFMEKAVPIVGSPQLASWDLLLWDTVLRAIQECQRLACEDPGREYRRIMALVNQTPDYRVRTTPRSGVPALLDGLDAPRPGYDPENTLGQLRAMMAHDVAAPYAGSLERASQAVRADVLVVTSRRDHVVQPEPARDFARLLGAPVYESNGDCGHTVFSCETEALGRVINSFLAAPRSR